MGRDSIKRMFYIPKEALPDISKFLSLDKNKIENLIKILMKSDNITVINIYLDIMNELDVNDDDATSIFAVYKYFLFILEERKLVFSDLIPEIGYILKESKIENYEKLIENMQNNLDLFNKLFIIQSTENIYVKKKSLSSEIYNSVIGIRSICDFRPLFNDERSEINEMFKTLYIEFTIRDSVNKLNIIPLSFDDDGFDLLLSEIDRIKQKKEVMDGFLQQREGSE
jgi:hypothetical protein